MDNSATPGSSGYSLRPRRGSNTAPPASTSPIPSSSGAYYSPPPPTYQAPPAPAFVKRLFQAQAMPNPLVTATYVHSPGGTNFTSVNVSPNASVEVQKNGNMYITMNQDRRSH